ncbi:unnamed protein product [Calicophoron daubneyi]|uniref:EF-hand domain-containing protein n=1 Tax=Calicophoron daubneyi TaxID=300641 RepID=A0AAV2TK24_CALDB
MGQQTKAKQFMAIFNKLDKDNSGVVSTKELLECLTASGVSRQRIDKLMKQLDLNNNGEITLGEYRLALGISNESIAEWRQLFESLDKDRTGKINGDELMNMFKEMGGSANEEQLKDWIMANDVDGDGTVDFQEFLGFVADLSECE